MESFTGGTPWGYGSTCTRLSVAWRWWEAGLPGLLVGALQRGLPRHADLAALHEPAGLRQHSGLLGGFQEAERRVCVIGAWGGGSGGWGGGERGEGVYVGAGGGGETDWCMGEEVLKVQRQH